MKLLGRTKTKIIKDQNGESVSHLDITEVLVNNDYQRDSRVLYKFFPNKWCDQLLDISPKVYIFQNIYFRVLLYEMRFTDQNSKPLEIEDKVNIYFSYLLGISKVCNTILQNFLGWGFGFVLPRIFKSKLTNLKILGCFSNNYALNTPI